MRLQNQKRTDAAAGGSMCLPILCRQSWMGYIEKFAQANRVEINRLLLDKLSDGLWKEKKLIKINSLLTKLRRNGVISNAGSDKASRWQMVPRDAEKK